MVTGGGQGIGRALVERFGAEGMKVVLADVVPGLVETTTGELADQGLEVTGVVTDVTSLESVEALRDATLERYGRIHLVRNNVGIGSGSEGQIWEHHVNDWRWSLDVNVMGVVNGINAFVPTMLAQGEEGHVVNTTSSNGGFTPLINSAVYATTKAAVTTITECLWGQLRETRSDGQRIVALPVHVLAGDAQHRHLAPGGQSPRTLRRDQCTPHGREGRAGRLPAAHEGRRHGGAVRTLVRVADICFEGILNDTFWITVPKLTSSKRSATASRPGSTAATPSTFSKRT